MAKGGKNADGQFVDDYLPALLAQASHLISGEFHRIVTAKGFTVSEWRVLASLAGAEPMSIDYDMESTPAGWKVYDVKIAGVSLVMTYRESFAAEVRAGGIDGLIKALSDRSGQNAHAKGAATERLAPLLMLYSGGVRAL